MKPWFKKKKKAMVVKVTTNVFNLVPPLNETNAIKWRKRKFLKVLHQATISYEATESALMLERKERNHKAQVRVPCFKLILLCIVIIFLIQFLIIFVCVPLLSCRRRWFCHMM